MADPTYQFRAGLWKKAATYTLTDDALNYSGGRLPLREVTAIRIYTIPGLRSPAYGAVAGPTRRCTIRGRDGRKIVLSNIHFLGFGRFEDRTQSYLAFVRALVRRVAASAQDARLAAGMPPAMWWFWAVAFGAMVAAVASIVMFGAIGLILERQLSWGRVALLLLFASIAIGPASFLHALCPRRTRPMDPNEI